jgi:hypothetical protein
MNGVDTLSYLDIPTGNITAYTAVATPAAPTLSANNVGTGSIGTITYRITANSAVGQTAASSALSTTVDTDRDLWKPLSAGGTDNIVITLPTAPTNAVSWNIYMGTVPNFEYLIASGVPITSTTFTDDGSFAQDPTRLYPTTDSTAGPKASRGANIGGRAWLVGDADHPYYVRWGGDFSYELDFSPANGGGFVPVGNGSKDVPIVIKQFRDGKGTAQTTVLCQGTNGRGKRFLLSPDSVTYGSTIISFYDVTEDNGQDGTDSPDGVIAYGNSLYYPSRDGFKATGTKPQIQNVLTTDRISNTIQPDLALLNSAAMSDAVGLGFEGRLYWALPVSNTTNSEIWVLDLDRKGAWMKPWSIAADWMWLYNDNSGNTHHLILSDNIIYDLSYSSLTTDDGQLFATGGKSGDIYFSDDKRMWVQLLQVIFVILNQVGEMNFQIMGRTEDNDLQALGDPTTATAQNNVEVAGWGEVNRYIVGFGRNAWSKVTLVPTTTTSSTQEVPIPIDETVQFANYSWSSSKAGVDYAISDVIYEYVEVGLLDLEG